MDFPQINREFKDIESIFSGELYYNDSSTHHTVRLAYSTDASVYQELPIAVAIPKNDNDLKLLIALAKRTEITLIPRTAGTSLAGQVVGRGIIIDISKYFNKIIEVNQKERWVKVQPGVIRDDLNAFLKVYGLMFGPETSTASRAMIGGMIGNNSSGLHSIVWGDTRSHLLAVKAFLDDGSSVIFEELDESTLFSKLKQQDREGEIYRAVNDLLNDNKNQEVIRKGYPKHSITRRNTGYALDLLANPKESFNFCKLIAGSEGTLALVTEAKLNLIPLPPQEVGILCIHCYSLIESLRANIIALKYQPEASELVDKYILDFTRDHPTYQHNRFFIEGDPAALLMVEFRDHNLEGVINKANALKMALEADHIGYAYPLITGDRTNLVWDVRKAGLGLIRNLPGDTQPVNLIEDCAVLPDDLPSYIEEVQTILAKHNTNASYYAHAGAGELHVEPLINLKTKEGKHKFRAILAETAVLVKKYNGSLSGEHGDGRLRGEFIKTVLGQHVYLLLEEVKSIFDASAIFNANKIVRTPPMDKFLRYEKETSSIHIDTIFDFHKQENILRLTEKCSGSGDCRKSHITGGTMCPSYMATREEKDTTRARANILRQFLTHSNKANRFDHKEIKEVMDLCLSCKACKTECPSGVDVTKMKAEFLQHYYDANGIPFRTWLIANFTKSQKMGSYVPQLYNAVIKNSLLSSLVKNTIGFAKKRSLPEVGNITLRKWIQGQKSIDTVFKQTVYLFCDEFTNYNDTGIGQTAFKLLSALGYQVTLINHKESGRTYLSKGLLRKAKKIANHNIRIFKDLISAQSPLVGIEPSAILTFRDEYIDLVDKDLVADAQRVAEHTLLIDEFIAKEIAQGNIKKSQFKASEKKIKLHGHCYQKAFHLVGFTEKILSFPTGYKVETIPSGCCGMAGSFGYEREHYPISQQVGELVLFPSIRAADPNEIIVAPGTSCRHQIKDATDRKAHHPVEILWDALVNKKNAK
ncbi:FAD-linked oxidase C-terminal domain-containing protein [Olivibacter sp. CPCC 100613]|uniref:FAD-binding and (Fe-S)-binding domain-containing protein n=1 Tax=Olivibacter sp. CPCC 100613 TaxID=3079931 RepID=UPI002FF6EB3F